MIYRLRPGAEIDLRGIWRFTAEHWNADQAERYVGEIRRTIERLANGDLKGRSADTVRTGYRRQATGSHMIYYQEVGTDIEVVRILHQRMKAGRHLG